MSTGDKLLLSLIGWTVGFGLLWLILAYITSRMKK